MIINIKGTSGSGKSTIVREVLKRYPEYDPHFIEGRKQPLYTVHLPKDGFTRPLVTIGHYNTPCGGCDTINKQSEIFRIAREGHNRGWNVLYEGLLVSGEVTNTAALHQDGYPLSVICLDVDIKVCLDSVNTRRWTRNPDLPPVKPDNTIAKHRGVRLAAQRLEAKGVDVTWCNREQALAMVLRLLGW